MLPNSAGLNPRPLIHCNKQLRQVVGSTHWWCLKWIFQTQAKIWDATTVLYQDIIFCWQLLCDVHIHYVLFVCYVVLLTCHSVSFISLNVFLTGHSVGFICGVLLLLHLWFCWLHLSYCIINWTFCWLYLPCYLVITLLYSVHKHYVMFIFIMPCLFRPVK